MNKFLKKALSMFVVVTITVITGIIFYFSLKVSSAYMRAEANSTMVR
jgi:K+-transporting ATPase c subunit